MEAMNSKTFFSELKRRNVYRVALSYAVIAWLVVQSTSILLAHSEGRSSVIAALIVIVVVGFFLAI